VIEQVGGTAATNPWHDHRLVLLSPADIELVRSGDEEAVERLRVAFGAAPPIWGDELSIRLLVERQMGAA
jgi:hypothetical protein